MNLQLFTERLLWCSAVLVAAIPVALSLVFAFDICRDGLSTAPAPNRRDVYSGGRR